MLDQFELVARAVADPGRVRILKMLEGGELCVCQVTAVLDLSAATVSKHLSLLRMAGLLSLRKEGRWVYYRLAAAATNPYAPAMLAVVRQVAAELDPVLAADRDRVRTIRAMPPAVLCAPEGKAAVAAAACGTEAR